jgi:hypothetical protein
MTSQRQRHPVYAQSTNVNRHGGRLTMSHMRGGRLRFIVMNSRVSGTLNRGEHRNHTRRRQHLTPHTIAPHHTIERRQHRHQPSTQVTAILLTHVDFVVTILQWDVVFVPQQVCNVSIAQKWTMWPRFAVAVLRLQMPTGLIHARGVHTFALCVRVNLRRYSQTKTFSLYI